MNDKYVVVIGKEGFAEQEIREGIRGHWGYGIHFDDNIYETLVAHMLGVWIAFPPDKFINETDPTVWLRKEEAISAHIACLCLNVIGRKPLG